MCFTQFAVYFLFKNKMLLWQSAVFVYGWKICCIPKIANISGIFAYTMCERRWRLFLEPKNYSVIAFKIRNSCFFLPFLFQVRMPVAQLKFPAYRSTDMSCILKKLFFFVFCKFCWLLNCASLFGTFF